MHSTWLVLVAVAAIFLNSDAAQVTTNPDPLKVSSAGVHHAQALRGLEGTTRNVDKYNDDDNDEERVIGNVSKVDDVADYLSFLVKTFQQWDEMPVKNIAISLYKDNVSPEQIAALMKSYTNYRVLGGEKFLADFKAATSTGIK
ncbi:hypothetical protein PI125_g23061 [Phytophthora idaei]|nr:hypothetical protein PI125_g23061 [Phytophthora idaei]